MDSWPRIRAAAEKYRFMRETKQMLSNIHNLDRNKQKELAYYAIELSNGFRKRKRLVKYLLDTEDEDQMIDELVENGLVNSLKLFAKRKVYDRLVASEGGLHKIGEVFKSFRFLHENERQRLVQMLVERDIRSERVEYGECDIGILAEMMRSGNFRASDVFILRCIGEGREDLLQEFRGFYALKEISRTASLKRLLEHCAVSDESCGAEHAILRKLEKLYGSSKDELLRSVAMCREYGLRKLHKAALVSFMKEYELVDEYLGGFMCWISDLVPLSFADIFLEGNDSYRAYSRLFSKLYGSTKRTKLDGPSRYMPSVNRKFLCLGMRYPGIRRYLLDTVRMSEEDMVFFITKTTKRGDFEFYLNALVDDSKIDRSVLEEYRNNGVADMDAGYLVYMRIYRAIIRPEHRCDLAYGRLMQQYNVKEFVGSEIGVLLICRTIPFLVGHAEDVDGCREILSLIFDLSQEEEIGELLWNECIKKRSVFVHFIDRFTRFRDRTLAEILLHKRKEDHGRTSGERIRLRDIMMYVNGPYESECIEYVVCCYGVEEIVTCLLAQDEDDRDFLYECVHSKAMLQEIDMRVLVLEDETWANRIFDQIFRVPSEELFSELRLRRPELLLEYCCRHGPLRRRYFDMVNKKECSIEEAAAIHKILLCEAPSLDSASTSYVKAAYGCDEEGNETYRMGSCVSPVPDGDIIEFMYLLTVIRPGDSRYYFCEYLDEILSAFTRLSLSGGLGSTVPSKPLAIDDVRDMSAIPRQQMVEAILSANLKDRYVMFIAMDRVLGLLKACSQPLKLVVLRSLDASIVTTHVPRFTDLLVSLLNDSNANVCMESKRLLNQVPIKSPELLCLRSQLIQAMVGKMYVRPFLTAIRTQMFSNYLCSNGLSLLTQILIKHMVEHREDVFPIMRNLRHIARDSDLEAVFPAIFDALSCFVIENVFYLEECCGVAVPLMAYGSDVSFDRLIEGLRVGLRVGRFLVSSLSACDIETQKRVVDRIIRKDERVALGYSVEPLFLAYAPELPVFGEYLPVLVPLLKSLFLSQRDEEQKIAARAFEHLEVTDFILHSCITADWRVRSLCIDLLSRKNESRIVAILFIMKNDPHTAVRKKAFDAWKGRVSNANVALRDVYGAVLGCLRYKSNSRAFEDSVLAALNDMATKYDKYIPRYLEGREHADPLCLGGEGDDLDAITEGEVTELILAECARLGKHLELCLDFGIKHSSTRLLKELARSESCRERVIEAVGREIENSSFSALLDDSRLVMDLYGATRKPFLFKFMANADRMRLLERHIGKDKGLSMELLGHVRNSAKLEQLLLSADPEYAAAFYTRQNATEDFGSQRQIFSSMFNTLPHSLLGPLVRPEYLGLVLDMTYKNLGSPEELTRVLILEDSVKALTRLNEVVSMHEDIGNLCDICGHLLYNYLDYGKRESVLPTLRIMYNRYGSRLGPFELLIKRCIC
jgi:hypothetical protein